MTGGCHRGAATAAGDGPWPVGRHRRCRGPGRDRQYPPRKRAHDQHSRKAAPPWSLVGRLLRRRHGAPQPLHGTQPTQYRKHADNRPHSSPRNGSVPRCVPVGGGGCTSESSVRLHPQTPNQALRLTPAATLVLEVRNSLARPVQVSLVVRCNGARSSRHGTPQTQHLSVPRAERR
jgi:hypothetical protein